MLPTVSPHLPLGPSEPGEPWSGLKLTAVELVLTDHHAQDVLGRGVVRLERAEERRTQILPYSGKFSPGKIFAIGGCEVLQEKFTRFVFAHAHRF